MKRVLVVEDTEDNRRIIRDLLTSAGYEMIEAVTGEEGVAKAAEHHPDLILMDMQLPVLDGYQATQRIKAQPDLKHIPIIAVTSYALSGDEAKTREAGCDGYVAKPFSPRQLLATVRAFVD
ncbi:MAG: response regulator [Alphaproteobacteria bacterium]|nr:response regulator [Alphaproteobacteria bacterium]